MMKSLSNYTNEAQTKLFEQVGAFFAFSNKQFDEAKEEGTVYVSLGTGLIAPKNNAKQLFDGLADINKQGIAQDLAENGRKAIIERELSNYECFYTWDISDCVDALVDYDITKDDIITEFNRLSSKFNS